MKLRKVLALMSALVLSVSVFASTAIVADAAVEGVTATLEFAGYEVKGTTTFAKINVKATIPDTLVPYTMIPADWETTFEDSYEGLMLQGVGFEIPNVAGLTYVASLSSKADYITITDNKTSNKVILSYAATGAFDTYYAGSIDTLATLYYRMTGDTNAAYDVNLTKAVIGLFDVNPVTGSGTPREYKTADFTIKNTTVKPAAPSVEVATTGAWDTGSGILVIGKVTGDATEKGITIAGYTLPEASSNAGMGPNFAATAPASAQGYYGVYIAGIEAGTYTVNAYADAATGATTTVTKN